MDPIATYAETRFSGKRQFELFSDTIRVHGKTFLKSDFDSTIPLKSLNPDFSRLRVRESAFVWGMWLIIIAALLGGILVAGFKLPADHILVVLVTIQPVAGLAFCLATFRKVEFYCFQNDSGVTLLDVARAGKEKDRFDDFAGSLTAAIRTSRESL